MNYCDWCCYYTLVLASALLSKLKLYLRGKSVQWAIKVGRGDSLQPLHKLSLFVVGFDLLKITINEMKGSLKFFSVQFFCLTFCWNICNFRIKTKASDMVAQPSLWQTIGCGFQFSIQVGRNSYFAVQSFLVLLQNKLWSRKKIKKGPSAKKKVMKTGQSWSSWGLQSEQKYVQMETMTSAVISVDKVASTQWQELISTLKKSKVMFP